MSTMQTGLWLKLQDELQRNDGQRNAFSKEPESDECDSGNAHPVRCTFPYLPPQIVSRITEALAVQPGIDGQKGLRIAMPTAAKVVRYRCHVDHITYGFERAKNLFDYLIHLEQIMYDGLDNGQQPLISVKEVKEKTP